MKRGHRRTQSQLVTANHNLESIKTNKDKTEATKFKEMKLLLQKGEENIKNKVLTIDNLNGIISDEESKMFCFGKGNTKNTDSKKQKDHLLNSIPEKCKSQTKNFKKNRNQSSTKKKVTKIFQTKYNNANLPFDLVLNAIINQKVGLKYEKHTKKHSVYEGNIRAYYESEVSNFK